jgi:hypothetical protein
VNEDQSRLIKEWEAARADLGIEITAPYEVELPSGRKVTAKLLVKHFGHRHGTLIFSDTEAVWPYRKELAALGYAYSVLEEPTTQTDQLYDRDIFIDMLSEWEWTGDEQRKPQWILPSVEQEDN